MSKRIDYKKLASNIPHKVEVGRKVEYEVMYSDTIKSEDVLGEMRPKERLIILKNEQSSRETVLTLFHEFLHSVSEEHKSKLTESQVRSLEKAFPYFYKFIKSLE
jgi:hypothetical protein